MEKLFFDFSYTNFPQILLKVAIFIGIAALVIWGVHLLFSKIFFKKNQQRKEINIRTSFLWTLFTCFMLFNIYFFIVLYWKGVGTLKFGNSRFYLGALPQITIYIILIILFFVKNNSIKKIISTKSAN